MELNSAEVNEIDNEAVHTSNSMPIASLHTLEMSLPPRSVFSDPSNGPYTEQPGYSDVCMQCVLENYIKRQNHTLLQNTVIRDERPTLQDCNTPRRAFGMPSNSTEALNLLTSYLYENLTVNTENSRSTALKILYDMPPKRFRYTQDVKRKLIHYEICKGRQKSPDLITQCGSPPDLNEDNEKDKEISESEICSDSAPPESGQVRSARGVPYEELMKMSYDTAIGGWETDGEFSVEDYIDTTTIDKDQPFYDIEVDVDEEDEPPVTPKRARHDSQYVDEPSTSYTYFEHPYQPAPRVLRSQRLQRAENPERPQRSQPPLWTPKGKGRGKRSTR